MSKGRYTLGDKLQQHVVVTDHSRCTCQATSFSNTVRRHVAATNRFLCTGEFFWKYLSMQQNFVAATSCKKSNRTEFVRLVAATKFCCSNKDFHKNSPLHTERFVAAMCHLVSTNLNEVDVENSERATLASYFILVRILYKQKTSQKKGGPWFLLDHPLMCPWLYLITINNYSFFLFYSLK